MVNAGDVDAGAVIVFANHSVVARREGASELDVEFGDVSCHRAPGFDGREPGPIPKSELWGVGWWFDCVECENRTSENLGGKMTENGAVCEQCREPSVSEAQGG